jgi:hypothetical protein
VTRLSVMYEEDRKEKQLFEEVLEKLDELMNHQLNQGLEGDADAVQGIVETVNRVMKIRQRMW